MTKQILNNVYAVILAGGSGTRFWPMSRQTKPKQLCKIGDNDKTMLELTIERLKGFIPKERIIIVTHVKQHTQTQNLVGHLVSKIIAEPCAKNTAPALALAAFYINSLAEHSNAGLHAVMLSLHADHVIRNPASFVKTAQKAIALAQQNYLGLIGVEPKYAETGYGYIKTGVELDGLLNSYKVANFAEKPDLNTAEKYIKSKNYLWNTGLFCWKIDVFLNSLTEFSPDLTKLVHKYFLESNSQNYEAINSISIDNAILEKASNIAVVSTTMDWQDVGSWDAITTTFKTDDNNNFLSGDVFSLDCTDTLVDSSSGFVATIGLQNIVIVKTEDALLVCNTNKAQDVKKIVEYLKENNRTNLL